MIAHQGNHEFGIRNSEFGISIHPSNEDFSLRYREDHALFRMTLSRATVVAVAASAMKHKD
jgi:hypothetical protein